MGKPLKRKMVLNRDYRLGSTLGHVIVFKKGVEIEVPDMVVREAVDIGAEFVEEGARDEVFSEKKGDSNTPTNPSERLEKVREAIEAIFDSNDRDDFTATGNPTMKAVQDQAGFKIDKGELIQVLKARNEDQ